MTTDVRISTPLLSHQREALDFIERRERETEELPSSRSLWEYHTPTTGKPFYQHLITGGKSEVRDDFCGGIIADEMGLGKSLTMLSAIVGSFNLAKEFAQSSKSHGKTLKATLVIVPSALLLDSWSDEIKKHIIPGTITHLKYHGQSRSISFDDLAKYDVVLTTYATAAADYRNNNSPLTQHVWYRVVLDEAHVIRNWTTKQFGAVARILSHIRWCLSGTPIQNTLTDLGALVRFLKVPILHEPATFRRFIACPLRLHGKDRFSNLRLLLGFRQEVDMAISGYIPKQAHQIILEVFLRLRLFCNNGAEIRPINGVNQPQTAEEVLSCLQQDEKAECSYCSVDIVALGGQDEPESAVLFSFWKTSLDVVGSLLRTRGLPYTRIDGSLSLEQRRAVLHQFQNSSEVNVLLMTLGTGALGLNNLSIANHVHILEPQWNPSVENQAIGRFQRMGQARAVTVYRYIMNESVEQNVESRQNRKLQLAHRGFSLTSEDNAERGVQQVMVSAFFWGF
ncbi:hypothetical protein K490DRAFT_72630 [Saccharata proteae CBS 121410]|uniref:P-loop containing nucleoside triphosphate hydrolase protein n=1 Tax=Saccharata proteae CBS 121410 TaxID=1314787 RepID=A0A6A5YBX3_9PEZI|nr:hypothetical protein K490DRAFT_72630 [Saccharata proteae CBS 121410]